jgi:methylenetetrahydrofolate dehydrogenase (NADP+)/methenyltetrahydrofolate cyclohydrolase
MSAKTLDGKWVRDQIFSGLKPRIAALKRQPGLAVVLIGDDPASEIYVRNKVKACADLGIHSEKITPPADLSTLDLLAIIRGLNERDEIDGILVQSPMPPQIDHRAVLSSISPDKDADGFHPINVGNLVANIPAPRACTPAGIMEMLRRYDIPIAGKHAVVIGRSDIVGKPMALLLLHANATVTICHSKTANLAEEARRADILIAAIGKPGLITREFIKPGATVIDVGMNRVAAGTPGKTRFVGDVDPLHASELASVYTPVPGGVGPLTIAMLMSNTVDAAERRLCSA